MKFRFRFETDRSIFKLNAKYNVATANYVMIVTEVKFCSGRG